MLSRYYPLIGAFMLIAGAFLATWIVLVSARAQRCCSEIVSSRCSCEEALECHVIVLIEQLDGTRVWLDTQMACRP